MSIRLRLTLLYTVILALTLAGFGATLYSIQLQSMLRERERPLADVAQRIVESRQFDILPFEEIPYPRPWGEGGPERRFGDRPIYVQIIDLEGRVIQRSEELGEVILPLSDSGLQAVQQGQSWIEMASVEGGRLLIYSTPVFLAGEVAEVVQVAHSIEEQDWYLGTMRRNLLIGGGAAVVVAFGFGWVLSGVVLRPIHRITQTARAIGDERDLSRRVPYAGPNDELGQLATTLNMMLAELETAYRQQQQFVADVSHELRTPLTTLRGNLELLRREPPIQGADRVEILTDMAEESERLIRLVNDLLTLAHTDARQPLRSERVPIRPLVEDVCRQSRLIDPIRSIDCGALSDLVVMGDPDALKQILLILVDNALKHTDGAITVAAKAADGFAAVSVRDSGPGIEPEMLPHMFTRFYRSEKSSGERGSGLGLAIAKALVEAQGGAIAIDSQVESGSTLTITLPLAAGGSTGA